MEKLVCLGASNPETIRVVNALNILLFSWDTVQFRHQRGQLDGEGRYGCFASVPLGTLLLGFCLILLDMFYL